MSEDSAGAASSPPGGVLGAAVFVALALAGLTGCIPQTGDFGRPKPNVVDDFALPLAGGLVARERGEPVSSYRWTDEEVAMHDLGWGVVMPPLDQQWRGRVLAELKRTRILPSNRLRLEKENYVRTLLATDYRSSRSRYERLIDDVVTDTRRVEPFFRSAARVADGDRVRGRAIDHMPEVAPEERERAEQRIGENGLFIAWVRDSFEERLVAYRYALDRLTLETPDRLALEADAAISQFDAVLKSLRPLAPRGVFKG